MMLQTFSLASSPSPATVRVDKATSEFLLAPDWTMNMEICDAVNADPWTSKQIIKQVKKRLLNKNPRVQLLSLTLLETIVKNCSDHIHYHIAERKILDEMIKLAKKRGDMQVRDKVLVLLDHWQEAFGGPGGRHSQYNWAYDQLRRSGVHFPRRSSNSVPIITPPATHHPPAWQPSPQVSGMPSNSSRRRLDEAMASEGGSLSFSTLESMRNVMELLADMLQAVNPNDRLAVKDEVIVDLVNGCRTNQRKLIQMLSTVVDEGILAQGIDLNEALQGVLAKHDAIASGSPLPTRMLRNESNTSSSSTSKPKSTDIGRDDLSSTFSSSSPSSSQATKGRVVEGEEDQDDFARLAKRHGKRIHVPAASSSNSNSSDPSVCNALVLNDLPPAPDETTANTNTKEQDMVDLLSIVLSSSFTAEEDAQQTPNSAPAAAQSHTTTTAAAADNNMQQQQQQPNFNTYVAPWALAQPQMESPPFYSSQDQSQQHQMQQQTGYPSNTYSFGYPPPPWAATPGYLNGHGDTYGSSSYLFQNPMQSGKQEQQQQHLNNSQGLSSPASAQAVGTNNPVASNDSRGTLQRGNSLSSINSGGVAMNGMTITSPTTTSPTSGQKPAFVPPYRLFEDLNVFGTSSEGKMRSGPYSSASGNSSKSMVGGRR